METFGQGRVLGQETGTIGDGANERSGRKWVFVCPQAAGKVDNHNQEGNQHHQDERHDIQAEAAG